MENKTTYRLPATNGHQDYRYQLVTLGDLDRFKVELLKEMKYLLGQQGEAVQKQWLKSYEVQQLLGISPNTLQHFRDSGQLPFTKVGGTIYYEYRMIEAMLKGK